MCPSCGDWFNYLNEQSGWCASCTIAADPLKRSCTNCGGLFLKTAHFYKCWACRKEEYLERHADQIELYLQWGYSFTAALKQVADDLRPNCHSCGQPIKGGREDTKFCQKTKQCRKQALSYQRLKSQGLSPDVALAIATGRVIVLDSKLEN